MTVNDTDIFAGTGSGGIYQSTNNGAAWTQNSLGYFHYIYSLVIKGSAIFAGAGGVIDNGLYVSSNYGISWTQMMPGQYFWALNKSGANIIAGTNGNGVYISSDNGMNWEQYNDGMGNQNIYSLLVTSNFIYAGTSTSIWKRSLSQLVGAGNHSSSIPQSYKLHQNFPNPFNPSTNISYDVRNEGIVRIRIFDALGNEITTLINEKHDPGNYELTWDAGELTSGVYYCKFEVNDFSETRKMALVK
jgi:hypothetical protein